MHKKTEMHDFDIPKDDIECWEKYPKHRWVYELSRLLDAQNIKWSPFEIEGTVRELNIVLETDKAVIRQPGYIFISPLNGDKTITECYIVKGEIKLMRHVDEKTGKELPDILGGIDLRLNAFVTLYFQKFTGVITTETWGNDIFRIRLRPYVDLSNEQNQEVIKIAKRIYKRTDVTVNGLTDRVHQEILAS